ncbi:phospholipid carrier-dependent glycosyltransferase [Ancylomarina longa]|uniref:Phospholipid carrier-dependent glycosyltransferase n=1 Tax=Ancylomarina longa TaxID=2487017 RepID=A0A434AWK6_9BACT|nr:phospholipid carrier-dependent glycosyltransferase [Ancylomarina longa]RUT78778.1 phospholipid carrier-dependent glycosyltransferase [Ancylomarina longa]
MSKKNIVILFVIFCYIFLFQGSRGIYESTEGRYADVAYTMLTTGDWIHPKLHPEQAHWTKPPVYYWATAASLKVFGKNTFAVRFPNALAYLLTILLVGFLGRIFTPKHPWLSALIFASCLLPIAASNAISTDGVLTLFETAAMACFIVLYFKDTSQRNRFLWSMAGSAFLGLAFLTKGPPALLPLLGFLVFLIVNKEARSKFRWSNFGFGFILFLVVGGTWFFYVINETPHLLHYFLKDEVVNRVATAEHKRNAGLLGGFIVYIPTLLLGTLPWSKSIFTGIYKTARESFFHARGKAAFPDARDFFLLCWILFPLLIFFVADSRLPLYIQPLFIPLALIGARNVPVEIFEKKRTMVLLASLAIVMILLRAGMGFVNLDQDSRVLAHRLDKITPRDYTEVVFVDTKPHYGLSIFLDVPIKRVDFRGHYATFEPLETLDEELQTTGQKRIWMLPKDCDKDFTAYLKAKNIPVKRLSWVKGRKTFGVYRIE